MSLKKLLLVALLVSFPLRADASFLIEPDLGFEWGTSSQKYYYSNAPADNSRDVFGYKQHTVTAGVKAAYVYKFLFAGPQFEAGSTTDMSAVFGLFFKGRGEAWVGYLFKSKDSVASGTGAKVGAGIAISKAFYLNAEYVYRTLNDYLGENNGYLTYAGTSKTYKITVSMPITF